MKNNFKNIVFDFDETLFFTSNKIAESYTLAIKTVVDKEVNVEEIEFLIKLGLNYKNFLELIIGSEYYQAYDSIHNLKKQIYKNNINSLKINYNIEKFIKEKYNEMTFFIWSNSTIDQIENILNYYGIKQYFKEVYDRNKSGEIKPSLKGLIKIFQMHQLKKDDTLIVDDSTEIIQNLTKNGFFVIHPNSFDFHQI